MRSRAESVRHIAKAAGLALAALAASPAIKTSGNGVSLAADTPPAVAQPSGAASAPAPGATAGVPVTPAADLSYQRETYMYISGSLRDPFASLVTGKFVADNSNRLPDIGSIELVGVMWGDTDKFAMMEDREGKGYVLRVGDPVVNGEVASITRDSVTIRQYFFGTSTSVTLKLKPREGNANAKNKR